MNLAIPINPIRRKKIKYTSLKVKDEYKIKMGNIEVNQAAFLADRLSHNIKHNL